MAYYENLSTDIESKILSDKKSGKINPFAFKDENATRRNTATHDCPSVLRSNFIRDADKILNCPFYNRYSDKTQVFSLNKNDDITRRSLHVQLVSRIARTIGKALNLNVELIESIALGPDIGHTPFGHTGEKFLDRIYFSHTNKHFYHNIHSVRVLDVIFPLNLTLQTLDGIMTHNGEAELSKYSPTTLNGFNEFDSLIDNCYADKITANKIMPSTLEGCVVRLSDIIAYLGKDRQDATVSLSQQKVFSDFGIGQINAEIVNNLTVNVIENSYDKPYIMLDQKHFNALKCAKEQNYDKIYKDESVKENDAILLEMMEKIYKKLLNDITLGNKNSPIFTHHIDYLNKPYYLNKRRTPYVDSEKNLIVVDYVASMTDDYFIDLFGYLFPRSNLQLKYKGYFN